MNSIHIFFLNSSHEKILRPWGGLLLLQGGVPNNTRGHSFGFYTRRRNNNIISAGGASRTTDGVTVLVSTI